MFKSLGRAALVGFVLSIFCWLALMIGTAVELSRRAGDAVVQLGSSPFVLTSAERIGDSTSVSIRPLGYLVGLAPLVLLLTVAVMRHRARQRRATTAAHAHASAGSR